MMKKTTIAMIALMLTTMTACEKASMDEDSGSGQVANALLQVRTRGGGGSEATVSYPVQVYVFQGDECKAVQTIGDERQTLTQQAAFLNFEITLGDYLDTGDLVNAVVYNDDMSIHEGYVPIVDDGGVKKAKFVLPVPAGTILSNATVMIEDTGALPFGTDGQVLKGKVYNVKGTPKVPLTDALKEGSYVTVYFNHQYNANQSCTFYNTGDYGKDMFEWTEGSGYIASDGNIGRQLIVDENDENILIFKQNWGEGWVGLEDNWDENGFQVTFNLETKTYTQWYGPGVAQIYQAHWYDPYGPPSFVRLVVNGCDVTSELTESTESE